MSGVSNFAIGQAHLLAELRRQQQQIDELTACLGNLAQRVHELEGWDEQQKLLWERQESANMRLVIRGNIHQGQIERLEDAHAPAARRRRWPSECER